MTQDIIDTMKEIVKLWESSKKVYYKDMGSYEDAKVGFERTGEYRIPRYLEWYISGAKPQAYQVLHEDGLDSEYYIVKYIIKK